MNDKLELARAIIKADNVDNKYSTDDIYDNARILSNLIINEEECYVDFYTKGEVEPFFRIKCYKDEANKIINNQKKLSKGEVDGVIVTEDN